MQIRYRGPAEAVVIASTGQLARQGEPVEVTEPIAKALIAQGNFEAVKEGK